MLEGDAAKDWLPPHRACRASVLAVVGRMLCWAVEHSMQLYRESKARLKDVELSCRGGEDEMRGRWTMSAHTFSSEPRAHGPSPHCIFCGSSNFTTNSTPESAPPPIAPPRPWRPPSPLHCGSSGHCIPRYAHHVGPVFLRNRSASSPAPHPSSLGRPRLPIPPWKA